MVNVFFGFQSNTNDMDLLELTQIFENYRLSLNYFVDFFAKTTSILAKKNNVDLKNETTSECWKSQGWGSRRSSETTAWKVLAVDRCNARRFFLPTRDHDIT